MKSHLILMTYEGEDTIHMSEGKERSADETSQV